MGRTAGLLVTWLACTVGVMACLPLAPALVRGVGDAGATAIGWTVCFGVFLTALAFSTWAYALSTAAVGRMGATTYHVPLLVVLMGASPWAKYPGARPGRRPPWWKTR